MIRLADLPLRGTAASLLLIASAGCAASQPLMVVNVPVADLRAQPHTTAQAGVHDPLEETQLLYGERVRVVRARNGWAFVEAVEQPEYTHHGRWQGYPGWLPLSELLEWRPTRALTTVPTGRPVVIVAKWARAWQDPSLRLACPWRLPLGSRLQATDVGGGLWRIELPGRDTVWLSHDDARPLEALTALAPSEKRQAILRSAALLIGDPYYWGGRSPADAERVSGVDCSGLVNLAYRSAGLDIPRDAHEQFLRAAPTATLHPADLIFLSERHHPARIVHVMLYAGDEAVLEGPATGSAIHRIALLKRLGRSLDDLKPGTVVDEQTVFFGTYLP